MITFFILTKKAFFSIKPSVLRAQGVFSARGSERDLDKLCFGKLGTSFAYQWKPSGYTHSYSGGPG